MLHSLSSTKLSYRPNWLMVIVVLFLTGLFYRAAISHLKIAIDSPVMLPVTLAKFPIEINDWVGQDISIPEHIMRTAGSDDYIYHVYSKEQSGYWVNVYISYSGRPRTMIGHRPEVCYVAGGWICDSTIQSEFNRTDDLKEPCLIHRFHKHGSGGIEIVVLNYYVLNGRITNKESGFTGLGWRMPNTEGDPAHYVAQVQTSSVLESQV